MAADISIPVYQLRQKMFTEQDQDNQAEEIKLYYADLLHIHEFNPLSKKFYQSLQDTDIFELFDLEIVRKLIMFQWPII